MARTKQAAPPPVTKAKAKPTSRALAAEPAWEPIALNVRKAYKMYVGGAFVRSESGRYVQVVENMIRGERGKKENVPRGSRKDARDAVLAAHAAWGGWSRRPAHNRGQILYRLAEMLDARSAELERSLMKAGADADSAGKEVAASIDRVISYAGWADKYQSLFSSLNPVAGPHFDFTLPESLGVVAVAAPAQPALLGLVGSILPIITGGNTCIVLASEDDPRTAITFAEALATSDLPGGVVNILTGHTKEMLLPLAKHMEVAALDLWSVDPELAREATDAAADTVKRVRVRNLGLEAWYDHELCTSPTWIERFVEMKTIWHPSGS